MASVASCHDEPGPTPAAEPGTRVQIVLAGNPNVGKTTLFNALTGLSAKVSNYPGITVEKRCGTVALANGRAADLHDLPGTYSLNARSAEEQIAFDAIVGLAGEPVPDAAIVCVDATQLARSAYLLLQIQELGTRCVVALTMVDEAGAAAPDARALGRLLGCEVVAVTARTRTGLAELVAAVDRAIRGERRAVWTWQPDAIVRAGIAEVRGALPQAWTTQTRFGTSVPAGDDALALWALASIEPPNEDGDADELDVPASLREAVTRVARGAHVARDGAERASAGAPTDVDAAADKGPGVAAPTAGVDAARARAAPTDVGVAASAKRPGVAAPVGVAASAKRSGVAAPTQGAAAPTNGMSPNALVDHDRAFDAPILARWAFLDRELPKLVQRAPDRTRTERIDRILLHRVLGFAVFLGVMALMFMSLFAWSQPAIDAIERLFAWCGGKLGDALGPGILTDLLVKGVIHGVGTVMMFLPQILLLFLFLGFLEDCGYLARVAYLMDRIMRTMNLHGRAFVPMLSGFACAVPAILATRTMERRRDRILTMMVVPLMTCSARLPVYTLVIAAMIPASRFTQASLMVGMYLFSVMTALIAAWVMSRTVKPLKAKRLPFLIELPPYRFPRIVDVLRMMWSKSSMFLREAGTVILACSIALAALLSLPGDLPAGSPDYDAMAQRASTDEEKAAIANEAEAARLANSYGGRLGHAIEPVMAPLGFDWKIDVGLIGAFAAREVFVSTLGIVYSVGDDADEEDESLRETIRNAKRTDGTQQYTPLVGLSLLVFFALAMQCMSTLAMVRRETRSWRWPLFLFGYMTTLAWIVSFTVYQGGKLLGFG